jgi:hypothetical protein
MNAGAMLSNLVIVCVSNGFGLRISIAKGVLFWWGSLID